MFSWFCVFEVLIICFFYYDWYIFILRQRLPNCESTVLISFLISWNKSNFRTSGAGFIWHKVQKVWFFFQENWCISAKSWCHISSSAYQIGRCWQNSAFCWRPKRLSGTGKLHKRFVARLFVLFFAATLTRARNVCELDRDCDTGIQVYELSCVHHFFSSSIACGPAKGTVAAYKNFETVVEKAHDKYKRAKEVYEPGQATKQVDSAFNEAYDLQGEVCRPGWNPNISKPWKWMEMIYILIFIYIYNHIYIYI